MYLNMMSVTWSMHVACTYQSVTELACQTPAVHFDIQTALLLQTLAQYWTAGGPSSSKVQRLFMSGCSTFPVKYATSQSQECMYIPPSCVGRWYELIPAHRYEAGSVKMYISNFNASLV